MTDKNRARRRFFLVKNLDAPKEKPPEPVILLIWKDGGTCAARVSSLAPEVTCGTSRFRQDAGDNTVYLEV